MDRLLQRFREIWVWDSEFVIVPGWHVTPVCMAGVEVRSGASVTATFDHAGQQIKNPLPFGPDVLHILFSATADLGFSLAGGWGLPYNVLDLWVERRNLTNNETDGQDTLRHENPDMTLSNYTESSLESRLAAQDVMASAVLGDPTQVQ
jgi:hypothetical protein